MQDLSGFEKVASNNTVNREVNSGFISVENDYSGPRVNLFIKDKGEAKVIVLASDEATLTN